MVLKTILSRNLREGSDDRMDHRRLRDHGGILQNSQWLSQYLGRGPISRSKPDANEIA